jgi:predicted dehydrogenase
MPLLAADAPSVRLMTLDPGHFHAGLVQKFMYPQVSPVVHVYAPGGPDLNEHLKRIEGFNTRAENPTRWEEKVYTGPDFLARMLRERPGNVVVLSGNNAQKTEYIERSVRSGLHVLADKPMAITPVDFKLLRKAFAAAERKHVLLYDIMTERFELTSILQRELARAPEVFGTLEKGSPQDPAIVMESVHHFFKEVAGKPLLRPAWFYDVRQQGEAVPDVGTHLIDLVQWQAFPDQALNWRKDVKVNGARRWPTKMSPEQFKRSTGLATYPDFLKADVGADGILNVYQNGDVTYALRGVHAKVTALWNFEAPPGVKDTHYALMRGTRANLRIRQGAEQGYNPILYVEKRSSASDETFEQTLKAAVEKLAANWPGISVKRATQIWEIVVPQKYAVGHEAHFAQVTDNFLKYLAAGRMPEWEVPNMLAKYYTTTEALRLSRARK